MVDRSRELLEELVRLRKAGESKYVEIKHDDRSTTVCVAAGQVVSARSSEPGEPLGRVLLRKRLLTQEQYLEVLERVLDARTIDKQIRIGEVAVELGFVKADDVRACLAEQVRSLLARVFCAESPTWTKRPIDADRDASRDMTMFAEAAFLDAVRWLDDTRKDALGLRLARPLALAPVWSLEEIDSCFELTPNEAEFARVAMAGDKKVQQLLDGKAPDGVDPHAIITALVAAGAVETRAPGSALHHKSPVRRGPPPLPEWARVDSSRARDALEQIRVGSVLELKSDARSADGDASFLADQSFFRGKELLRQGRAVEATDQFERAYELERTSPEYQLFYRWTQHLASGATKMDAALRGELQRAARAALRQNPEVALAHFVLGEILRENGDLESARKLLRQALRMEPELFETIKRERLKALRRVRPPVVEREDDEQPSGAWILAGGPNAPELQSVASQSSPLGGTDEPAPAPRGETEPAPPLEHALTPETGEAPVVEQVVAIPPAPAKAPSKGERGGSSSRMLILLGLLLLVVVAGGAFVFFGGGLLATPPPPPPTQARTSTREAGVSTSAEGGPREAGAAGSPSADAGDSGASADATTTDGGGASSDGGAIAADAGVLVLPKAAAGRRVFVDGKALTADGERVNVACGRHVIKIGSKGREQTVDVACGRETTVAP